MRPLYLILLITCSPLMAAAQCLTDFNKLVPEPSVDVTESYGRISMFDNFLAIGLPDDDSLGRLSGIVKIYEKTTAGWQRIATLAPSDPQDAFQFGSAVKLSSNYLLVAGSSYAKKVYIFKKPADGWQSQTELTVLPMPTGQLFGTPYQTQNTMAISADEQTIAITDPFYLESSDEPRSGAVYVYHKQAHDEWDEAIDPVVILSPEDDAIDLGRSGVFIQGDRVITGTPFAPTGNGRLYVFRDPSGEFANLELEAKLSAYGSDQTAFLGYINMIVTAEGIFTHISVGWSTDNPQSVMAFYEMPSTGSWEDSDYTCVFPFHPATIETTSFSALSTNGTDLIVSSRKTDGSMTGYTTLIKKGPSGWCDPELELVDSTVVLPGQFESRYGVINAINQHNDIVVGLLPHPDVAGSNLALKIIAKNSSADWEAEILATNQMSTAGHFYGRAILGFEDHLFVGSSKDGSIKPGGGAVYVYKKSGGTWSQTGKIPAPVVNRYDDVFGSALATNGTQLAVGAIGFGEHGRVFIYQKNGDDWAEPELVQEIQLPEDILTVYAYGDNLAMTDEWLLIPYVQNAPARIMLAVYKHNGTEWVYDQVLEIGMGNLFAKSTSMAVAIEHHTVVMGNIILELGADGVWREMYTLSPSDPESARISPDFTHWITNGSAFGQTVAISNNTIFIGAPMKDDGTTWDVGAIYVYTKKPWESWSNRTESAKILPRVRSEREMFGYSMKAFGNTLIAGAPGADFNKDGTARNQPGRAYIFQTQDYFWQTVTPLLDLTGDSSIKDYFGLTVNLDENNFFISAPIEDLPTGKLSGSVYVTPAPPIVKLVPPVCASFETIQLLGYPFGGTWSGPGLVDATAGTFDPAAAGIGLHEFTYTTESCTYQGKLRIVVEEPFNPVLLVDQEHFVCQESSVQIPVGVQPEDGYQYLWYYREGDSEPFFPVNEQQATMTATARGEYKVKVFNTVCESFSPVITIKNDSIDLTLNTPARICEDASEGVTLEATPDGGKWLGQGVTTDGRLVTTSLANNTYTLTYQYTSSHQCPYEESVTYQLDRLAVPYIQRLGNLCVEGAVNLMITSQLEHDIAYSWHKKGTADDTFNDMDDDRQAVSVNERGIYQVIASDGQCSITSNQISIDETSFPLELLPKEPLFVTCNEVPFELSIKAGSQSSYTWYYAEGEDTPGIALEGHYQNVLTVPETGYYYAVVNSGLCQQETPRKHITIRPPDDLFVPNVFTPNDDSYNELFEIDTNMDILDFRIVNRYGNTVFTGGPDNKWSGKDTPAGVYYWLLTYRTCIGEVKSLKGFVHLMK